MFNRATPHNSGASLPRQESEWNLLDGLRQGQRNEVKTRFSTCRVDSAPDAGSVALTMAEEPAMELDSLPVARIRTRIGGGTALLRPF
jgi:hypothetical protein